MHEGVTAQAVEHFWFVGIYYELVIHIKNMKNDIFPAPLQSYYFVLYKNNFVIRLYC